MFRVNERTAALIMHQLLTAVNALHVKFVLHGRIRMDQLFIAQDSPLKIKLGGLNTCVRHSFNPTSNLLEFTSYDHLPPEILLNLRANQMSSGQFQLPAS
jgi:hypothetical protein